MAGNTKDLYLGSVGVGLTAPFKSVPAVAIVDSNGQQVFSGIGTTGGISPGSAINAINYQVGIASTFSRPGTAVTFTSNFVMGPSNSNGALNILTFVGCGRYNGGSGMIMYAQHHKSTGITTAASYRLHLFNSPPSGVSTDNSAHVVNFNNMPLRVGIIDFNHQTGVTTSSATFSVVPFVNTPFICSAASTNLYGVLTPTNGVAGVSGESHYIRLEILQN